jgi:hypothetical protein
MGRSRRAAVQNLRGLVQDLFHLVGQGADLLQVARTVRARCGGAGISMAGRGVAWVSRCVRHAVASTVSPWNSPAGRPPGKGGHAACSGASALRKRVQGKAEELFLVMPSRGPTWRRRRESRGVDHAGGESDHPDTAAPTSAASDAKKREALFGVDVSRKAGIGVGETC